jgi:hypothetical protein
MFSQFNEYRRRVEPCETNEADIHVEVRFDNQPDENQVGYIEWGKVRCLLNQLVAPMSFSHHNTDMNKIAGPSICLVPKRQR